MVASLEPSRFFVRVGATDPLVFGLKDEDPETGVVSVVDLTNYQEVRLAIRPKQGGTASTWLDSDPELSVSDAANGEVSFTPGAGEFTAAAKYDGWIRLTDQAGTIISFPNDDFFELEVLEQF